MAAVIVAENSSYLYVYLTRSQTVDFGSRDGASDLYSGDT